MTAVWEDLIRLITDGESVNAANTNRPTRSLVNRTEFLKNLIQTLRAGEALVLEGQSVDASTTWVGSPVYWDSSTSKFTGAKAVIDFTPGANYGHPGPEAMVRGVVVEKPTSTTANIMICGLWRDATLTSVITTPSAGMLYLTSADSGKLAQGNILGKIQVGYYDGTNVFVNPVVLGTITDHVHYKFDLTTDPASSATGAAKLTLTSGKYTINSADVTEPGWLPASHASFGGHAPSGAKFGYNFAEHEELWDVWPPQPLDGFSMELTGPSTPDGIIVPDGVVVADEYGLWWMDDCESQCPWEHPYPNPAADPNLCTHNRQMVLWLTKLSHLTSDLMVTSLKPCSDSPIQIEVRNCVTGEAASTGDLCLYLENFLTYDPTDPADQTVAVKEIDGDKYRTGSVLSTIKSATPRLNVAGTALGDAFVGDITLSLDEGTGEVEGSPELVALNNARQEVIQGIPYVEFPASRESEIVYKIALPTTLGTANLKLCVWMLCSTVDLASTPALPVEYSRIVTPSSPSALSNAFTALGNLTWPITGVTVGNQYAEVESPTLTVSGGDLVLLKVSRSDSYSGNIGLLKVRYVTTP